ncbi:carboxypeptidase-like regulatory domain-containing protein [Olivibacter sp. SDN3]|uniref:carboxypeptidase-like regulatory domain-containing protein n=1 Tax=Olivibacter sp. SDN3 TaxID=2764720 RepID=UPI00165154B7|nr:carboxypeptidase-like regulatory domain-containing protein [Olivibacter sp. SDN3]QNL51095.1 carboxypeptidase-like regulatory domain-containing protein [Olivibacter sp. SDN3]
MLNLHHILLGFILLAVSAYAHGQTIKGTVIDEHTGETIPYATLLIEGKNVRTIASREGMFILTIDTSNHVDEVKFRSLGYEEKTFNLKQLISTPANIVKLNPVSFKMDTVSIAIGKQRFEKLGYTKVGNKRTGWGDFASSKGRIRGVLIENPKEPTKIKSFHFRIIDNDWDSVAFRVNFQVVKEQKPDSSILSEDIIIHTDKKRKWVTLDLDKYNLSIDKELIAVLEWVDAWGTFGEYSNVLTLSLSDESGYVYSKEAKEESITFEKAAHTPAMFFVVYAKD